MFYCSVNNYQVGRRNDIVVGAQRHGSARSKSARISTLQEYRECVAIPYLDRLIENINRKFTDEAVKILSATSFFDPTKFSIEEALILAYGLEEIRILADFYGNDATVEYEGTIYTSSPLLDRDKLLSEWKTFRRALIQEKKSIMQTTRNSQPSLQDILQSMQEYEAYKSIFPQMFSLMNILLAIPMSTATVERSFSQMKLVKNRLRNRLSDVSLPQLMRIAIEGPELTDINFEEILDIFAQQNRRISYNNFSNSIFIGYRPVLKFSFCLFACLSFMHVFQCVRGVAREGGGGNSA